MAAFFRSVRQGFTRSPDPNEQSNNNPASPGHPNASYNHAWTQPGNVIPAVGDTGGVNMTHAQSSSHTPVDYPRFFFQEKYAKLGVKGNFMPLAAQPVNVDLADWLAHQTVENYRLVSTIAACVQECDQVSGKALCNPENCPTMTAGRHTYTWLDNNKQPVPVSAPQYISLVQRWMNGKIHDTKAFPSEPPIPSAANYTSSGMAKTSTEVPNMAVSAPPSNPNARSSGKEWLGKESGFPESFLIDCRTCFRQIFRIYAHIYHSHWINPFWHISSGSNSQGWTDLNSCFVHFCTVAKLYGLLSEKDAEPMKPLIDMWINNGSIPAEAANETHKILSS